MKTESITVVVAVVLALLILNPFHFWMPTMMHMVVLAVAVIAFSVFAVFVVRERAHDEREDLHRMFAGRAAFLLGASVLMVGIVVQSVASSPDPWLIAALLAMIFGKMIAHMYSSYYR